MINVLPYPWIETDQIFWYAGCLFVIGLPNGYVALSYKGRSFMKPLSSHCPTENRPKMSVLGQIDSKCKILFSGPEKERPCLKWRFLIYWASKLAVPSWGNYIGATLIFLKVAEYTSVSDCLCKTTQSNPNESLHIMENLVNIDSGILEWWRGRI